MSVAEYFNELAKHGRTPQAVDAPSQQALDLRWEVMGEPIAAMDRVLDVGCGYGGFGDWLEVNKPGCRYTGIDVSGKLVALSNHRSVVGDVRQLSGEWDYVVGQGLFYKQKNIGYCLEILAKMWELATKSVIVTTILKSEENELSFTIPTLLEWVEVIGCTRWTLRHDYHPNDVCLYLYK